MRAADLGHVVRSVGDGGGDEELEEQHEVLQHDDQEHGLGAGYVGEQAMHWPRQACDGEVSGNRDDCDDYL